MAAGRINIKFIVILLCTITVAGGVIGGLIILQIRGDASRQIRMADELLQEDDYEGASSHLGRAVRLDPGNLEYLERYKNVLLEIRPETGDAAREWYSRLLVALQQGARVGSSDPAYHLELIEELYSNARLLSMLGGGSGQRSQWERVVEASEDMLDAIPETDPQHTYARLYRGIAQIRMRSSMSNAQLSGAEQDIIAFLDEHPESDMGWAALVDGQRLIAEHYGTAGNPRDADEMTAKATESLQQAIEAVPDGPAVNRVHLEHLADLRRDDADAVAEHELRDVGERTLELAKQSDDPWHVLEVSRALQTSMPDGRAAARDLFTTYVDRNPDAYAHQYFLAMLEFFDGELDDAAQRADRVIEAPPLRVSFISQMQLTVRRLAASLLVDVEIQRYSQAEQGDDDLSDIESARDRLAQYVADPDSDPTVLEADAKLAMLKEDYDTAAARFERLIREGTSDPQLLVSAAFCLEQIGEIGLAYERTVDALQSQAASASLVYRKARLEYLLGRYEEAAQSIEQFLSVQPENAGGIQLARMIEARLSGESIEADDPVAIALADAGRAMDEGDTETARATIAAAMTEAEDDDPRLLHAAARLAMNAGRTEEAREHVSRALELRPDSRVFRQMRAVLDTGDPVEAAVQFAEAEHEEEGDRAVMLALTLNSIAERHEQQALQQEARGETEAADLSRDVAQRAASRASEQLELAGELAPDNPQLIEHRFSSALRDEDWSQAEMLANRARDLDLDNSRGLIYRGRLELQRGRFDEAVRAFQQATEAVSYSSTAWRGLAMSYQQLGNLREAQRAYEQAYRANPNDQNTVRNYLALLGQVNEFARAVRVAETAYQLRPNDDTLREAWLQLEAEMANLPLVIPKRREIFEENPDDRQNAMRLAMLLSQREPMRALLLDDDGEPQYSDRRWQQLAVQEQRRLLDGLRQEWFDEAEAIVQAVQERFGEDLSIVAMKAAIRRERGSVNDGEQVLRAYIDSQDQQTLEQYTTLAQYLVDAGQYQDAYEAYQQAIERQDPQQRRGDRAMGDFLFARRAYDQAVQHYERVLEVNDTYELQLRVVEALVNQQRYDDADERLQTAMDDRPLDYVGSMLQAMIAQGQGMQLLEAGRESEAQARFNAHSQALDTAQRLMPTNPAPHVARAKSLLNEYRQTERLGALREAIDALDRADSVRANEAQTRITRIEVLQAMGDVSGAIAEARRLVEGDPGNIQYRQLLVQILRNEENYSAAVRTLQDAIERQPSMAMWYESLGQVYVEAQDMNSAAQAYRRAFEVGGSVSSLGNYVGVLMNASQPDYGAVVQMLQGVPEHLQRNPVLEAAYAVALHKTGREDRAMQHLQRSHQQQRQLVSEQGQPDSAFNNWYRAVQPLLSEMSPDDVEQFVEGLTGGEPGARDLMWIARRWNEEGEAGYSRATELLSRALDLADPDDDDLRDSLRYELGGYQLTHGDYEAAAESFLRVLQSRPDHALSLNNVAYIKSKYLDEAEEALPHAQRAAELMPENASVLDTLGWVHYKLGNHSQAEDALRKSISLEETAASQLHLAYVLAAEGQFDSAITRLRRAAELQPDSQVEAEIDRLTDDIRTKRAEAR